MTISTFTWLTSSTALQAVNTYLCLQNASIQQLLNIAASERLEHVFAYCNDSFDRSNVIHVYNDWATLALSIMLATMYEIRVILQISQHSASSALCERSPVHTHLSGPCKYFQIAKALHGSREVSKAFHSDTTHNPYPSFKARLTMHNWSQHRVHVELRSQCLLSCLEHRQSWLQTISGKQ